MKWREFSSCLTLALTVLCFGSAGCGSKSNANTISITLSSSVGNALILGQSTTLTATVSGSTNLNVTWVGCTYTTTPAPTTSNPNPKTSAAVACPSDNSFGALSNEQITGTATFTAPSTLPSTTTFPGLVIIITVEAQANTNKTQTINLTIDSGISVSITPSTAAIPTKEQQSFIAILANDLKAQGVTWLLTQQTPTTSASSTNPNPYQSLTTCTVSGNASGCGSITSSGLYTAPSAVPTNTTPQNTNLAPTDCTTPYDVTIVATSVTDTTRFALGTITVTQGGPITFSGITPTIAPQGAAAWDIFLTAPNISSSSNIVLTDSNGGKTPLGSGSGQVKVLFPIPTSSTTTSTTPAGCGSAETTPSSASSIGARIRLNAANLLNAGPVTVSMTDPGNNVTTSPGGTFTYNIMPVRPTSISSTPADLIQNTVAGAQNTIDLTVDGGYFGPGGQFLGTPETTLANVFFQGTPLPSATNGAGNPLSTSKQLNVKLPTTGINTGLPGLYSLSVSRTAPPLPAQNNPSIANLAVFPSYATDPPLVVGSVSTGAGTNPGAIDIDPILGIVAVVETSANAVQFYSIGSGTLTPTGPAVTVGSLPTGLSINRTNHTVAVVNYGDQSVSVLPIPTAPVQVTPFNFTIAGVLQGNVTPAPLPYAIGVDPDTNMGVVAYSSTSTSSIANLGFLVDLNPGGSSTCLQFSGAPTAPPCAFAQVTLNTGAYPQIAMAPHGHLAFVSPGGSGVLRGVDVTKPSTSAGISSLTLAAGIVTVTTTASNTLLPGNAGTVLISGVPTTNAAGNTNFNGVFTVSTVSDTSFVYNITSTASGTVSISNPVSGACTSQPTAACIYYSGPNLIFGGITSTAQGISINPITNTAALADADAIGTNAPEIDLINNLDQSVSSITLFSDCTNYTTTCSNSAELIGSLGVGTADIAWQPYSNSIVSYNPSINQVSVSDPVSQRRYALACQAANSFNCVVNPYQQPQQPQSLCPDLTTCLQLYQTQTTLQGTGTASIKVSNGTTGTLTLRGGLAVDPPTNQAFVVMSGSNQIDIINLGPCTAAAMCPNQSNSLKPVQITEVLVPSPNPGPGVIGGIPGATVPNGTLTSPNPLAGVQIFGSGFDATSEVFLDGTMVPAGNVTLVNGRQLTATIPPNLLSFPHRYALTVVTTDLPAQNGANTSNPTDFFVVQAVDMTAACTPSTAGTQHPSSVAIADQLRNGPFSPIAVVTNSGCNNVSVVDVNPADVIGGTGPNPGKFGTILNNISVGATPEGVAVSQPFGLAVTANNSAGTASVVNLLTNSLAVPDVSTGTNPTGVAINDASGAAIVTNNGSNTITQINLGVLFGSSPPSTLTPVSIGGIQQPAAVAIDPDRGTNNQGIAVVTSLQLVSGSAPTGALAVVDIGLVTPVLSTTLTSGTVTAPATGIVFDPTVITGTANNGVFYASSSGGNIITSLNPDNGSQSNVNVGINPTALALNPQTGAIMTTNVAGKTTSIVDTTANPLKTVETIGLPGSPQFGVAIDQFTNLAFIVDQGNNRLLIFAVPN